MALDSRLFCSALSAFGAAACAAPAAAGTVPRAASAATSGRPARSRSRRRRSRSARPTRSARRSRRCVNHMPSAYGIAQMPDAPPEREAEEHDEQRVGGVQRRHGGRLVADVVELVDPRGRRLGHARRPGCSRCGAPSGSSRRAPPSRAARPATARSVSGAGEADGDHRRREAVVELAPPQPDQEEQRRRHDEVQLREHRERRLPPREVAVPQADPAARSWVRFPSASGRCRAAARSRDAAAGGARRPASPRTG